MMKLMIFVATLAAMTIGAGAANAGVTCSTDAAAEVAAATVTGPRTDWNPPVWSFFMADLNEGVDVQADTLAEAQGKAETFVAGQVSSACAAEQQAAATTTTHAVDPSTGSSTTTTTNKTTGQTTTVIYTPSAQAKQLAGAAQVSGPRSGSVWTVYVPSLKLGVDVTAASAAAARNAAMPVIDQMLGNTSSSWETTTVQTVTATTVAGSTVTIASDSTTGQIVYDAVSKTSSRAAVPV